MDALSRINQFLRRQGSRLAPEHPIRKVLSKGWDWYLKKVGTSVALPIQGELLRLKPEFRSFPTDYEGLALRSFLAMITPGEVVWDVGAYVGVYALLAGRRLGDTGSVVAWEANPVTYKDLQRHMQLNGMEDRVRLINAAVNDASTRSLSFALGTEQNDPSINRIVTNRNEKHTHHHVEVEADSLDHWATRLNSVPGVIKIDIEGAEVLALEGATLLTSGELGHPPAILLSAHPHFVWEFGCRLVHIDDWVERNDYIALDLQGRQTKVNAHGEYWLIPLHRAASVTKMLKRLNATA